MAKSSATEVQRWYIVLSIYSYNIQHRDTTFITHTDYFSLCAVSEETPGNCLLTQCLLVNR